MNFDKLNLLNETSSFKPEVATHLSTIRSETLNLEDSIAFHATSTYVVLYLLNHGVIPGSYNRRYDGIIEKGDIFFYPNYQCGYRNFWEGILTKEGRVIHSEFTPLIDIIIPDLINHANSNEFEHSVLQYLNDELCNDKLKDLLLELTFHGAKDIDLNYKFPRRIMQLLATRSGKSVEEILSFMLFVESLEGGFIMGVSYDGIVNNSIRRGDDVNDFRINFPKGLSYEYITFIKPLADYNKNFLNRLIVNNE